MEAKILKVDDVLKDSSLKIPHYQRPYRWEAKNVRQLLEDILLSMNSGKKRYRIGSIILHDANSSHDIVDGQQRLTTILLADRAIKNENQKNNLKYKHFDSLQHIRENYAFIKEWLKTIPEPTRFWDYIVYHCEFVQIMVKDLSEAFQMFDTQNGRGKSLEPYNLLKAYHIRAMEQISRNEKILCDRRWESATQYDATPMIKNDPNLDILKQLFAEQLYRSRVWCRKEEAGRFSNKKIEEFKGFTVDKNHPIQYPFQNPQLLRYLTTKFYNSVLEGTIGTQSRFEIGESENINPFVNINQDIVNGKDFFDYVETYVEMYKKMFIELGSYQLSEFKEFYYKYCLVYNTSDENWEKRRNAQDIFRERHYKANRSGDTYLREVYKSLCFVLFDKFGEKGLNKYYKQLYRLVYNARLMNYSVKYVSAAQLPSQYFEIIFRGKDLTDLMKFDSLCKELTDRYKNKEIKVKGSIEEKLAEFIQTGKEA